MHFLIDADLPRASSEAVARHGHEATDVRDMGLGSAPDRDVAAYARANALCLLTGDLGFADIRNYPPDRYAGIVVLRLPKDATAKHILNLIEAMLCRPRLVERLSGRLAIVEPGRVRLRPA